MKRIRAALNAGWPFLWTAAKRFSDDMGSVLAGNIAYSLMLAVVPFLIFATALTGFLVGAKESQIALDALFSAVPQHMAETLKPVLLEVIGERRGGLLTLSALATIWAASNGVEAVRIGLDRAYDVSDARHVALNRLISIGAVLTGFAIFTILSALIVFAPLVFILIEQWTPLDIPAEADLVRYALGLTVLALALWPMHRILPSRSMRGMRLWPGVLASVAIWGVAATGFSIYLAFAPSYTVTYGTLAGVIMTLLFFYLTGVALIFGAEVNAVVNADRLRATTGPDAPPGAGD
ncbi:MAG TPA: YihY/virulence factor BrkB family protein [Thermohalobaculum sp.]|nr:YihY/virulence factor BrkB family protein [Thermohalobaculum sp.]